jgi:hypothetical protein
MWHFHLIFLVVSTSIYIYKSESGWPYVFVLLGSGGLLLRSGGVFFGVRSGGNDIFDIYYGCYSAGAFSLGSVLGPLLGNDISIKSSLFFGVCSGAVAWQPDRFWGPPRLLFIENRGSFSGDLNLCKL